MSEPERTDVVTRFQPGNVRSLKHGAHSEVTLKKHGTIQKRRILRQIGLRQADLDGLGVAYLDNWARAQSKVELLDQWFSDRGFLDSEGEPAPGVKVYFVACNSARLALARLEAHLATRDKSAHMQLSEYLGEHYAAEVAVDDGHDAAS
jgi:hypothetical protein